MRINSHGLPQMLVGQLTRTKLRNAAQSGMRAGARAVGGGIQGLFNNSFGISEPC